MHKIKYLKKFQISVGILCHFLYFLSLKDHNIEREKIFLKHKGTIILLLFFSFID